MIITPQIVAELREYFPEFADDTRYPDATILRALKISEGETGSRRWGRYRYDVLSIKVKGLFLYAAHTLTMDEMRAGSIAGGAIPVSPARVASKSVGDESVSYAISAQSTAEQALYGDLALTVYGMEFIRLRSRVTVGAIAV